MPMQKNPRIYIASPMCFRNSPDRDYEAMIQKLMDIGWEVLDPRYLTDKKIILKAEEAPCAARCALWRKVNPIIYTNNISAIDSADAVLAILNGMEPDSGTSFEVGYAVAKGKHVEILRDDSRSAGDNAGCVLNIMPQCGAEKSGGRISRHILYAVNRLRSQHRKILRKLEASA